MNKRGFGKTGLQISNMGFGCGGFWGLKAYSEKQATSLVRQAIDGGVNFFDTGASYSGGNAESRLGKALSGLNLDNIILGTKAGTKLHGGKLIKDYSKASIVDQVETSLRKLKVDCITLLQLHGFPECQPEDAIGTLKELRDQGKCKFIGISCDGLALDKALKYQELDAVMLTYNLIEQKAIKQIRTANANGLGVLIKSPTCHGLYSNQIFKIRKIAHIWYLLRVLKNYRSELFNGRKYRFVNKVKGWSGHEIALLFALHDKVSCVVTGTTNPKHMTANINSFKKELPAKIRKSIEEAAFISKT